MTAARVADEARWGAVFALTLCSPPNERRGERHGMKAAVLYGPGDVRVETRDDPAPVRRYLPELIDLVLRGEIDPGKVFDLTLPLERAAEGYGAMDERRAIETPLRT